MIGTEQAAGRDGNNAARYQGAWRRDYCHCRCERNHDDCPHCGHANTDVSHRGPCHARAS